MCLELINLSLDLRITLRKVKAGLLRQHLWPKTGILQWELSDQLREDSLLAKLTSTAKILHRECLALAVMLLK